ncbi:MAG TPA: DEAD/DEAH box helicase [Actinomycetota bacterium]|jgi:ATP-dependent RNA helicase HelY|nr:DEAD/DEAH box helicase [Actinomycetota bacterium]
MSTRLAYQFASGYPFALDPFQIEGLEGLARGESVLVSAPTGSGKTVVGEFAVWLALREGGKAFYTTPLKALSNQKFGDLSTLHGVDKVGLLTGDNSINPQAPVVVMTTEVLRNMIYERSELLQDLRFVILDEVHYLQDRYRGAVWEEVIIHLPLDVKLVSLSATLSNAEEFADWLQTLRGPTRAIIEESRVVELRHHYLIDGSLYPMFVVEGDEQIPNPHIRLLESRSNWSEVRRRRRHGGPRAASKRRMPRRPDLAEFLRDAGMLPAIYFIFSRKGCDAAVAQCLRDGVDLTNHSQRHQIREYAENRCAYLDPRDLDVLGYPEWLEALTSGIAAHHAGLIPVFKETVEELFKAGLVRLVFATETLSLGINMPARTVLIESLNKFTGERHEMLTPGQFTQLTGRAGRRGIDVVGHAVVPQQPDIPFRQIAALASTRSYPLISSFQPSYNMATNLVRNYSREEAEHLLNSSFAQYRTDRDVVVVEQLIDRNEAYLASYRERMRCDRGDFERYWELREQLLRLERSSILREESDERNRSRNALAAAQPGQVWTVRSAKVRGPVVIIGAERSKRGDPRVTVLTTSSKVIRLGLNELGRAPKVYGNVTSDGDLLINLRSRGGHLDHGLRRQLAALLSRYDTSSPAEPEPAQGDEAALNEIEVARSKVIQHPCHDCVDRDRHAQWAERAHRLQKENDGLRKRVMAKTETLSRQFERILGVLDEYGYLEGFNLTEKGWSLSRIYNENDLLISEALSRGWLKDLDPAELAALVTVFVYESRGPYEVVGNLPTAATKKIFGKIVRLTERIRRSEARSGLDMTRGPQTGFAATAYEWCRGATLEEVLGEDWSPGDFIRSCKQTVDLLSQLQQAVDDPALDKALTEAMEGLNRGVVAYSGVA